MTSEEPKIVRRGSVKGRFDDILEEQKKKEAEKLAAIRSQRMAGKSILEAPHVKNKWQETIQHSKEEEMNRFAARKAETVAGFQQTSGSGLVHRLVDKFNQIHMQNVSSDMIEKRIRDGIAAARRKRQLMMEQAASSPVKSSVPTPPSPVFTTPNADAATMPPSPPTPQFPTDVTLHQTYLYDLPSSFASQLAAHFSDSSSANAVSLPVGVYSDTSMPLLTCTAILIREDNDLSIAVTFDSTNTNDRSTYGKQKFVVFAPPSESGEKGDIIIEATVDVSPVDGWQHWEEQQVVAAAAENVACDPSSATVNTEESTAEEVQESPVEEALPSGFSIDLPPSTPPPSAKKDFTTPPSASTTGAATPSGICMRDVEHDTVDITLPSTPPSAGTAVAPATPPAATASAAPVTPMTATTTVPMLVYHELHHHKLIPTSILTNSPSADDTTTGCIQCHASPTAYFCPSCQLYVCLQCSKRGNGVTASLVSQQIELNGDILFKPGYATIMPESYIMLHQVARVLLQYPLPIRIEGHINTVNPDGTILPNNSNKIVVYEKNCTGLQLSQLRAQRVADYLVEEGVSKDILNAVGCGGSKPVTRDVARLYENRRVEIHFMRKTKPTE